MKEKISQLFISKNPDSMKMIQEFIDQGIGGFMIGKGGEVVSQNQIKLEGDTKESLKSFLNSIKEIQNTPLFLAIDGEGGEYFNRLENISNYKSHRAYGLLYESNGDLGFFEEEVDNFASLMKEIGFNMNFAPIVDVAQDGYKGYLAEEKFKIDPSLTDSELLSANRSYSNDKQVVKTLVVKAMEIFRKHNILSVVKHFPSYGVLNVDQNPHLVLPEYDGEIDFSIWKELFTIGCDAVMKGHMITNKDKDEISSLSLKTDVFLRELGFDGLVISDELNMGAIKVKYSPEEVAVKAVMTNNVLLISDPDTFIPMRDAILKACEEDDQIREKVEESYMKVMEWKGKIV